MKLSLVNYILDRQPLQTVDFVTNLIVIMAFFCNKLNCAPQRADQSLKSPDILASGIMRSFSLQTKRSEKIRLRKQIEDDVK